VRLSSDGNRLTDVRNVAVVVRLALSRRGRLIHGEVVETEEEDPRRQRRERFDRWGDLAEAVRTVLGVGPRRDAGAPRDEDAERPT
jgi:hypothetical protein